MSVARKIELARQLEEAERTLGEAPPAASSRQASDDRLERRRAIVGTLKWMLEHEHEIRAWAEERKVAAR